MLLHKRLRVLLVVLSVVGLVACGEPEPWVGSWSAELGTITFHDLGTAAPPAVIGGVTMTPFPPDAGRLIVNSVPSPLGGAVAFDIPMSHRLIGSSWATWSHDYHGDVYATDGLTSVTLTLPPATAAFYLYVEPNPFATFLFTVNAVDGSVVERATESIDGNAGAHGFAFTEMGGTIESITVSSTIDFAVGEFGIARTTWIGADTTVDPANQLPTGFPPYEYYLGRVGFSRFVCNIFGVPPRPLGPNEEPREDCSAFELSAARMAQNTFAYWYLKGPLDEAFLGMDPYEAGRLQANLLIQQWSWYNARTIAHDESTGSTMPSPVIDGLTLFGDIEPLDCTNEENRREPACKDNHIKTSNDLRSAGWAICGGTDVKTAPPVGSDCEISGDAAGQFSANATSLAINRRLLYGFLSTISAQEFVPGVYTNAEYWTRAFGQNYQSPDDFVLWTAGCRSDNQQLRTALADFPSIQETTMGGMPTVLWQYSIEPDYDLASQNPAFEFSPPPRPERAYHCTCGVDCPFRRENGLYLDATVRDIDGNVVDGRFLPGPMPASGGTVTISNPLDDRSIELSKRSISIDPHRAYSQDSDCGSALPPHGSCKITVRPGARVGNALLIVRPPNAPEVVVPIGSCPFGVNEC